MRAFIPSETALVLGGGGAKGAYEVGAIAALDALGVKAGSVFGTSVGALHAAMYAQGSMDAAAELWSSIRLSDVVSEESLAIADDAENIFDHPEKLLEFITRYAHQKGVDVSPLMEILHRLIDEDRVRRSGVRLGVVTTRFPSLAMVEKRLEEMEAGSLHDWLMASASCFPIFPMKQVGGDRYIDGGFCDNTPVEMAVRSGARDIIAIDIGKHRSHTQYDRRPNVTYIRTSQPLGGLLTLDSALSARNRTLGYNDVMRAFGRMRGVSYAFDAVDAQALYTRAQDYVVRLTQAGDGVRPFQRADAEAGERRAVLFPAGGGTAGKGGRHRLFPARLRALRAGGGGQPGAGADVRRAAGRAARAPAA
ncbi:MAG: patatin-like phospholipase family protein [Christensenellales bacterium]